MTPEELDEARAKGAWRIWNESEEDDTLTTAIIAARLAREGWTPPEPVDPDLLAFREFASKAARSASLAESYRDGGMDSCTSAHLFLAGARMAREQERERANHPIAFAVRVMAGVFKDLDHAKREARAALARYRGEA